MIVSAGGVVVKGKSVLLLQTNTGKWVLPKGHVEAEETQKDAALREVFEESGIKAKILRSLGHAKYHFYSGGRLHHKIVFWYKMDPIDGLLTPQREEGFVDVRYIDQSELPEHKMYDSELQMIKKALV